jgi:ribosomal protein S18 acetylase RimI-like enzyme
MPPPLIAAAELGISYRPLTDGDLPFAAELYASTRREEVAQTGWPVEMQEAFLRQQHEAQHRHYSIHFADAEWLIIERAGEAIGRLYLRNETERLHIIDISLLPPSRGQGIGGAILQDIFEMARPLGADVSISVEKNNPARSLYERLGFEVTEDLGVYDMMRATP